MQTEVHGEANDDWNYEPPADEVFDALRVPLYVTDAQGYITYCNPAAVSLWGRHPRLGRDRWCGCHQAYAADGDPCGGEDCALAHALEGRKPEVADVVAERPDGSRVRFRPFPAALRDADGHVAGAFAIVLPRARPASPGRDAQPAQATA